MIPPKIGEELKGLSKQDTVKKLSEHLNALGVETQTQRVKTFFSKADHQILVVPNKDGAFLNQLAFNLKNNFGTNLLYRPFSKNLGSYQSSNNSIYMSDFSALSGLADFTLMHEIRHASMTVKENRGNVVVANGYMAKSKWSKYPWRKTSTENYDSYMSMQEFSTYYQGRTYQMNEFFKRMQSKKITHYDFLDMSVHESVFKELEDSIKYLLENIEDKNSVRITQQGPRTVRIQSHGYFYRVSLLVPPEFIGPNSTLGIEYARSYLEAFLKKIEQAQEREAAFSSLRAIVSLSFRKFEEIPENQELFLSSRNVFAAMKRIPEMRENIFSRVTRNEQRLQKYISDALVIVKEVKTPSELEDLKASREISGDSAGVWRITLEDSYGTEVQYAAPMAIMGNFGVFKNTGEIKKIEYIFPAEGSQKDSVEVFLMGLLR